jgi:hypothetical protein
MTNEEIIKKIQDRREELKGWLYGTIYKQYDTEETAQVVQEDVDTYFSDEWIRELVTDIK